MVRLPDVHASARRVSGRASGKAPWRAGVVAAVVASLAFVGCMPASASNVPVRHSLFGMHDGTTASTSLARLHEGSVRLWDVGVRWNEVERTRGHYDFSRLDQLVTAAQKAHAEVTMVVAMTPKWYSSSPTSPPRTLTPYKNFVRALMKRYHSFHGKRGIDAYQVWNEANIATFWTGTMPRLAALTKAMYDVRNAVDRRAKVLAPGMVTRMNYQLDGLSKYFGQRIGGKPVWRYVDAVALSLYPMPKYGGRAGVPEDSIAQLKRVRKILRHRGVPGSKGIWNTEINYGLQAGSQGGTRTPRIPDARQASYVMRTYLLNAANGVKRVFWYRYDWAPLSTGGNLANTFVTNPTNSGRVTAAGRAYVLAQKWMHGTLIGSAKHPPCPKDRHGTYRCVVKDSRGTRYIYWNPFHGASVRLPKGVHHQQGVLGATSSVKPGSILKVSLKPVMVSR